MLLHIIICYGLYHSQNLRWIVEFYSPIKKKGISKAVWLTGGFLAALEIIRLIPQMTSLQVAIEHLLRIIHSYIVIQVFVEPIVMTVHTWLNTLQKVKKITNNDKT
jgi:hypothetical protein